jgi:hypothetical protein
MGDKSFGKGRIQAVYELDNGAGLVLTVARYITPGGTDIQGVGLTPDIQGHVPLPLPGMSTDTSGVDFNDIKKPSRSVDVSSTRTCGLDFRRSRRSTVPRTERSQLKLPLSSAVQYLDSYIVQRLRSSEIIM